MTRTLNILRIISRHTWWWTFAFIILLALSLTLARLLLPQLDRYRGDVEAKVSSIINQPVSIAGFEVGWHGLGPRLSLQDLRVMDGDGERSLMGFESALIDISVIESLRQWQLEFADFTLVGAKLDVERDVEGNYWIAGIKIPANEEEESETSGSESSESEQHEKEERQLGALAWILRQPHLALQDGEIRWYDQDSKTELVFSQLNIHLQYVGGKHLLGGQIRLPDAIGHEIELVVNATGESADPRDLDVEFYLNGSGLQFTQWIADHPALYSLLGVRIVNGSVQTELWGRWAQKRLQEIQGSVGLNDLYLAYDEFSEQMGVTVHRLDALSGNFSWQGTRNQWQLDVNDFLVVKGAEMSLPSRIHISKNKLDEAREFEIAFTELDVASVAELAVASSAVPEDVRTAISQTRPRGNIHNAYVKLRLEPEQPPQYHVRAELENLGANPWRKVPGMDGFDFFLDLDQHGGVATVNTRRASLDTQGMFRESLEISSMFGRLGWLYEESGTALDIQELVIANSDLDIQLDGNIDLFKDERSPIVNLLADIKRGDGSKTWRYLPVTKMSQKTVEWLDHGIIQGNVVSGAMVLHGPIKNFPFSDDSGRFEIRFNIDDGVLDYAPGWPRIEKIDAEVAFVANGMEINARSGMTSGAEIHDVRVEVENFRATPDVILMIDGEASGNTNTLVRFLDDSPLNQRFGVITKDAEADGRSHLGLSLQVPLKGGHGVVTNGWVTFEDSTVDLKNFGVDLNKVNGKAYFSGKGLRADTLKAEIMGQPAQLSIRTDELPQDKSNIVFEAKGKTRLTALAKRIDLPIVFDQLNGNTAWQAKLEIPVRKTDEEAHTFLQLSSNLKGVAVTYPGEISKSERLAVPFELFADFGADATKWSFDYDDEQITGVFELKRKAGETAINRAELRAGSMAVLPEAGMFRIAGKLNHFDADAWWPILFESDKQGTAKSGESSGGVTHIDVAAAQVTLFGQAVHDVKLQAQRGDDFWDANVDSREAKGNVKVPDDFQKPLEMDMERLYIQVAKEPVEGVADQSTDVDPRELPPLKVKAADGRYGEALLGQVELLTTRHLMGLTVDKLYLNSDRAVVNMRGEWLQKTGGAHLAVVDGSMDIRDMGSLLGGFGYAETIKHGQGRARFNLEWQASLLDPDFKTMAGMVQFDLTDGRILEVEPGAGRFFGLFSVQALPRRLMLDFSDFFGKGLAFDVMRGRFDIAKGNAVTENFVLDGPAALAELTGRVGLVARDYDQQLKVVPHVTSGLPLAGAVIGGVSVGAAVLLVEKLLKNKIDEATEIYYHITGSWDAPVMTQISQ